MRPLNIKYRPEFCDEEGMSVMWHRSPQEKCLDKETMTIINALDYLNDQITRVRLDDELWEECDIELDYLQDRLGLTPMQSVLLAAMCEKGEPVSWRALGSLLGLSRLQAMSLTPELEGLKRRRWVIQCSGAEFKTVVDQFRLAPGIMCAFRNNEVFEPEDISNLTEQSFVDRLARYVYAEGSDNRVPLSERELWLNLLIEANTHLSISRLLLSLDDEWTRRIMWMTIADYAKYAGSEQEGLGLAELSQRFGSEPGFDSLAESLMQGTHELFARRLIEHCQDFGEVDQERFVLTRKVKEEELENFVPHRVGGKARRKTTDPDLVSVDSIAEKAMFYNQAEGRQIERLATILDREKLPEIKARMEQAGLRAGITCLFYGAPGTGKTESVMQLARATGRDIMQVDISEVRDKYVGESEKNIKGLFDRYRRLCAGRNEMPILLFNEADALINSRIERTDSSADKSFNAVQNILLQELEAFDGILIATTNLTGALDKAFDRRFLFKVEFRNPEASVRASLWRSMLPELERATAESLGRDFAFSGGQIENVSRKCRIESVLSGEFPSEERLRGMCDEEMVRRSSAGHVGFRFRAVGGLSA